MKSIKENKVIFPFLLFLLPLWNVWIGVDVVDTGYSLTYFRYFEQLDGMWYSATFLANLIGSFLMKLPFGQYQLGINIYTSLLIGVFAAVIYQILSKVLPKGIVFFGEVLAIALCWCPMMILYHSLTYVLFSLGASLVIYGIVKQKNSSFILAGVALGVNAFVRMPSNLVQVILILVVWYAAILRKQAWKETMKQTLSCVVGYVCAVAVIGSIIAMIYGINPYLDGIIKMLQSSESASDYTVIGMVREIVDVLYEGSLWLVRLLPFLILGVVFQYVGRKKWVQGKAIMGFGVGLIAMYGMMKLNFFDRNYQYYHSVFLFYMVVVILVIISCLWYIISKQSKEYEKIMAVTVLLITIVMPFGTNNQFYANMNNMFVVFPFFMYVCFEIVKKAYEKKHPLWIGICSVSSAFFLIFIVQIGLFGIIFVFKDNESQLARDHQVEGIELLKGVLTNEVNGTQLEEIYCVLEEKNWLEKSLITFGNVPGLHYYLDMAPVSSVVWPDLGTSSKELWEKEIYEATDDKPIVIINSEVSDILNKVELSDKEKVLQQYLISNAYTLEFVNERYAIFGLE